MAIVWTEIVLAESDSWGCGLARNSFCAHTVRPSFTGMGRVRGLLLGRGLGENLSAHAVVFSASRPLALGLGIDVDDNRPDLTTPDLLFSFRLHTWFT